MINWLERHRIAGYIIGVIVMFIFIAGRKKSER